MHPVVRTSLRLLVIAILALLTAFTFAYVWPTLYRYDHLTSEGNTYPVRINRVTGDADMLVPDEGWVPVEGEAGEPNPQNVRAVAAR
jgi:hypothetical protein